MTSQSKQEIALKLKNARIQAGLTQAQVADKLGITYQNAAYIPMPKGRGFTPHFDNSPPSISREGKQKGGLPGEDARQDR